MDHFPFLTLRGGYRQMGREYGRRAGEAIRRLGAGSVEAMAENAGTAVDDVRRQLDVFKEDYRRYCPHILEEIEGVGEGAEVSFDVALLFRTRWDVSTALGSVEGCTSFAIAPGHTASGKLIAGQNKDVGSAQINDIVILRIFPDDGKPAMLNYAYYGMCEGPGINSRGLARFENSVWVKQRARSVPVHLMKRCFQESGSVDECVEWLERFRGDGVLGMSGNMTFGEAAGRVAALEIVPGEYRVYEPDDGILTHSNHLLHPELKALGVEDIQDQWRDTLERQPRMQSLFSAQKGGIDVDFAGRVLSDHEGRPSSICRHEQDCSSVAGLIAVPEDGLLLAYRGNPCEGEVREYRLNEG